MTQLLQGLNEPRMRTQTGPACPSVSSGDGRASQQPTTRINVGEHERNVSMAAGAILALQGLSRGSLVGLFSAAVGGYMVYRGATGHCAVYDALKLDSFHVDGRQPKDEIAEKGVHVTESMLIGKPAEQLYDFWRNFENLPHFMRHLVSVNKTGERRYRWVATAPKIAGGQVEWEAEVTAEEPHRRISWHSLPNSQVDCIGEVRFEKALGNRGTNVRVEMHYSPPGGKLGHLIAFLMDDSPASKIREDLRNFKRLMEVGEILTVVGQPRGSCMGGQGRRQQSLSS